MMPDRERTNVDKTRPAGEERFSSAPPPFCRVLMHNDDYTSMDFVVEVLQAVFRKAPAEATHIMLQIHTRGVGLCGVYPPEIAEARVAAVHLKARTAGFPLRCTLEHV